MVHSVLLLVTYIHLFNKLYKTNINIPTVGFGNHILLNILKHDYLICVLGRPRTVVWQPIVGGDNHTMAMQ